MLERRGELTVLYIEFVWYSKLEEIYGWQKLDEVLETTANAVREFYDPAGRLAEENLMMVSHIGDDDFIFFTEVRRPRRGGAARNEIGAAGGASCAHRLRRSTARTSRPVRHLRRRGDHLPQPEDPHGAADLPRHPRGGAGRAGRGVGADAQGGDLKDDHPRRRRLHRVPPDRRDGHGGGLRLRGARPRRAPGAALAGGAVRGRRGGEHGLGALPALPQARHRGHHRT
jgi:hypothetical protein